MNTITFKEPIDFQKYQLILNFLENKLLTMNYLKKEKHPLKKNSELLKKD